MNPRADNDGLLRVLFLGDVFGRPGRRVVAAFLTELRRELEPDVVVANVENAAGGAGISPKPHRQLRRAGIDVMTSGNHIWDQKPGLELLETEEHLLRPLNYPSGVPGRGSCLFTVPEDRPRAGTVLGVISLQGRVFMPVIDCPFRAAQEEVERLRAAGAAAVFVDFHAEATSEKIALARHLDGRAGAVIGTHTHVQTADETVLPGGTAFLSDAGMCGPVGGVIGVVTEEVMPRFLRGTPFRANPASGPAALHGVVVDLDTSSGRAVAIERVQRREHLEEA
jgi:2',3'-cyclic-nucleotide 2'-phosphodiesterase